VNSGIAYCRITNSRCGLTAHIEENRFKDQDALTGPSSVQDSSRIAEPMKRVNGTLTPVSWDTAIQEIGGALRSIRSQNGPKGIGLYLGERTQRSPRTLVRSLAFGVGSGTPHIFSEANSIYGSQLWATEQVIGHAASLISDLSRAHYVLLLSGEQRDLGWGPCSPGTGHEAWLQHSRKTKKTKVIVADPRRTELSEGMDNHLPIRPGSEPYLMLGMLTAIVQSGWTDRQFIRDYTVDYERLQAALADWKVEDFADLCGIDAPDLSGVALKFARSPMALVHPARQTFQNEAGGIGAWAWLALHAVTANILRPGGLFENRGVIDLFPVLSQLTSEKAPRTSATDSELLLMQAPATVMCTEIMEGPVRALISVSGNPLGRLPNPDRTRQALGSLELLVCIGHHEDATAEHAHWVLPASYPWEQTAMTVRDQSQGAPVDDDWCPPIGTSAPHARSEEQILADLYGSLRPGIRGSVWGLHLGLLAQYVARTDVKQWEQRFLTDWLTDTPDEWALIVDDDFDWSEAEGMEHSTDGTRRLYLGTGDRSLWRPSTESERIELLGDRIEPMLRDFRPGAPVPLVLRAGQWRDRTVDVSRSDVDSPKVEIRLHPEMGFEAGSRVKLETAHGSCVGLVVLDERLRTDVIDVPFYEGCPSLELLSDRGSSGLVTDGIETRISNL
jgi:anaerobic selenocysteine-containing dehydrogenase